MTGEPELTQHREQQQLETMLIGRIRTLESELADARVAIDELKQKEVCSSLFLAFSNRHRAVRRHVYSLCKRLSMHPKLWSHG